MMLLRISIATIFSALLFGCASAPQVPFDGTSHASPKLRLDAYNMVSTVTSAKGCSSIQKVVSTITEEPSGEPGHQKSAEQWVVHGCNREFPYDLTFTQDGKGGAYFSVKMEPTQK